MLSRSCPKTTPPKVPRLPMFSMTRIVPFRAKSLDVLVTDPDDVAPLRQTVLQLAVRGHLVPQDLNDEPASFLLERAVEERDRLTREGKLRRQKTIGPNGADRCARRGAGACWTSLRSMDSRYRTASRSTAPSPRTSRRKRG